MASPARNLRRLAAIVLALATLAGAGTGPALAAPIGNGGRAPGITGPSPVSLASPASVPAPASANANASAIVPGSVNRTSLAIRATYDVGVRLRVAARTLRGSVTITALNRSGAGIDRLELNTVMARLGALSLGTVTVDGTAVRAVVDDQTILVPLGGILPDGETVTIVVPFSATLRSGVTGSSWLFTRRNGITAMHRWIPWVSLRRPFDRPNHGDPFVTPVSPLVTVRIRSDVPLRYGNTGARVATSTDGLTRTFRAENVRDFVVTAAADYRTKQVVVGDTTVRVVHRSGFPATATLDAAVTAVRRLEARLGPYPYPVLTVVQSAGGYGMEGPGIVWIPTGVSTSNLRYLVTHEVAHQWFYALVGNDQAREPFADEAAADFAARRVLGMRRSSRCDRAVLDRSIYRYSAACYYEVVYIQGGNLLDDARKAMGSTVFWRALRGYIDDNRWGLARTRMLLDALDAATPLDMAGRWRSRFPSLY